MAYAVIPSLPNISAGKLKRFNRDNLTYAHYAMVWPMAIITAVIMEHSGMYLRVIAIEIAVSLFFFFGFSRQSLKGNIKKEKHKLVINN